jgi:hypothetical protein
MGPIYRNTMAILRVIRILRAQDVVAHWVIRRPNSLNAEIVVRVRIGHQVLRILLSRLNPSSNPVRRFRAAQSLNGLPLSSVGLGNFASGFLIIETEALMFDIFGPGLVKISGSGKTLNATAFT